MDNDPETLRSPDNVCKADPRNESFVVLSGDSFRRREFCDQHTAVAAISLHDGVPKAIHIQFETTKNLYLYSWFVYRFHPVAEHYAFTCLELALRERYESEMRAAGVCKENYIPGLKPLLSYAIGKEYLKNENFARWRRQVEMRARERVESEAIEEMKRLGLHEMEIDEASFEIKDVDRDYDYVAILLETMPWLRNHYAHGSKTLHNQVLDTLRVVAEIINQIYPVKSPDAAE